ncbi:MAG TPA: hypothetical protein VMS53_07240 [Burkholderiales bacterium]|nr:hypothetical protein [Burkholderiales bacterium]
MKVLLKDDFRDLAEKNGWSEGFAEGYVDGKAARTNGTQTHRYPLGDLDEYRMGFLAGYSLTREKRCRGMV